MFSQSQSQDISVRAPRLKENMSSLRKQISIPDGKRYIFDYCFRLHLLKFNLWARRRYEIQFNGMPFKFEL